MKITMQNNTSLRVRLAEAEADQAYLHRMCTTHARVEEDLSGLYEAVLNRDSTDADEAITTAQRSLIVLGTAKMHHVAPQIVEEELSRKELRARIKSVEEECIARIETIRAHTVRINSLMALISESHKSWSTQAS